MSEAASPTAIVAGGGIAGMAAAMMLADAGVRVTLLEARRVLGGRAGSFEDQRSGEVLDNCQHVAMGACVRYVAFLRRLGTADQLEWTPRQTWIEPSGRRSVLRPLPLPTPGEFAWSFLRARFLSRADKRCIARAVLAARRVDRASLATLPFGAWLAEQRQTPRSIARFWTPLIVSACNLEPHRVSTECALHVVQGTLLAGARASSIGVPAGPLVDLYAPLHRLLEAAGGGVRLGARVAGIEPGGVRLVGGDSLAADAVVCALDAVAANRLVTIGGREPYAGVSFSPILGVHLRFDRPVLDVPHAVLVDAATHWLFRKHRDPRLVHAVASAADDWVGLGEDAIVERVLADVARLPAAKGARLEWARAVLERRATFAATPEFQPARPVPGSRTDNGAYLAGDATATGWPATMESAVRSGEAAAATVLLSFGGRRDAIV